MEDALDELSRLVAGARELRPLGELLLSRLAALAGVASTGERLDAGRSDAGAGHDADPRQERVFELLDAALAVLRREEARATVLRLADAQRVASLRSLHERLDVAFRELDASGSADAASDWASEWPRLVEALEQQMLETATQRADLLLEDLRAPVDQREALAVVKHAFERLAAASATSARPKAPPPLLQDHEELLRVLFRRLVTFTEVPVPVLPPWFVSTGDIRIESVGGRDGAASVHAAGSTSAEALYAVWSRPDGREQRVVLKFVSRDGDDSAESDEARKKSALVVNEASLLSSVRHPNVLGAVGGCHVSRAPFVAFECPAPPGEAVVTLDEYLGISVDHQRLALRLLAQAARGLQALHDVGLAHGDVRCANILVGDDHRAKLANLVTFSLVRVDSNDSSAADGSNDVWSSDDEEQAQDKAADRRRQQLRKWQRQQRGRSSLRWQSPEAIAASKSKADAGAHADVGLAADVYALGVCLVEALAGELPWGFLDDREVRRRVRAGELPPEAKALDENITSLVEAMCDVNAAARPDIATVVDELEALAEEEQARDGVRSENSEASRMHDVVPVRIGNRGSVSDGMAETMSAIPRRRQSDAPLMRVTIGGAPSQGFSSVAGSVSRHRGLSSPASRVTNASGGDASPYVHRRRPSSTTSDISKYSKGTFGRGASDYDAGSTDALNEANGSDGAGDEEDEGDSKAFTVTVMLRSKWLGVKINSVGNRILLSKFLRSESGAAGELEASRRVALGDEIVAVNGRRVRGALDRLQLGALVQSLPRPLELTFRRDPSALTSSFRFHGLRVDARWRDRGSALALPGSLDDVFGTHHGQSKGFSLEVWFSIADVREDFYFGGVLLGAQDVDVEATSSSAGSSSEVWPYLHRTLLVVDTSGALWCDLLATPDGPLVVATDLLPNQWYHLVLTYTGSSLSGLTDQQQQLSAFLDGEKRVMARGPLIPEWPRLRHVTLGTGCMSGVSPAKPAPSFRGWFGFSGLVHDLRVWHAPLSDVQSRQLFRAHGGRREGGPCVDTPAYALAQAARVQVGEAQGGDLGDGSRAEAVKSTRPHHVVAQVYS